MWRGSVPSLAVDAGCELKTAVDLYVGLSMRLVCLLHSMVAGEYLINERA